MALEFRGSNLYYYEKERIGGKIRSVYSGKGDIALMINWLTKDRKEQEKYEKKIKCREKAVIERKENEMDNILNEFADLSKVLTDAFFLANGFHQHKREWRRKRNVKK